MAHLYELVSSLQRHLSHDASNLANYVGFKNYDFKEVSLEYGPGRSFSLTILIFFLIDYMFKGRKQLLHTRWLAREAKFLLSFGGLDDLSGMCPHALVHEQLEHHLNRHRALALTLKVMQETYAPLKSICRLPRVPQMGVNTNKVNQPIETFVPLAQSPTHVRLMFYNTYCLDVHIKAGGLIYVRDGAISHFDQRKVMDDVQPIPVSHY